MGEVSGLSAGHEAPHPRPDALTHHCNMLVLVVDDEPSVRQVLSRLLGSAGFRCVEAGSAEEAFSLLDGHEPCIGVFDIAMPGMSGAELAWRVRQRQPDLPLVAVSGHLDVWDRDDLADLGFERVFGKPFDHREFVSACMELPHRRRARPEQTGPYFRPGLESSTSLTVRRSALGAKGF